MRISIDVKEEDLDKVLNDKLNEIANFIFMKSQENLIMPNSKVSKYTITDTGFLLRSGEININQPTKIIKYTAPYADFIEYGTFPHFISPYVLIKWIERKLKIRDKQAISVAYAISKKIEKEGTDSKPFLRDAINQAKEKYKS